MLQQGVEQFPLLAQCLCYPRALGFVGRRDQRRGGRSHQRALLRQPQGVGDRGELRAGYALLHSGKFDKRNPGDNARREGDRHRSGNCQVKLQR